MWGERFGGPGADYAPELPFFLSFQHLQPPRVALKLLLDGGERS